MRILLAVCASYAMAGGSPAELILAMIGLAPTPLPDMTVCSESISTNRFCDLPSQCQSPVAVLTPENFQEALDTSDTRIWLLKFYAPWCGHCKKLAPVIEEAALKVVVFRACHIVLLIRFPPSWSFIFHCHPSTVFLPLRWPAARYFAFASS